MLTKLLKNGIKLERVAPTQEQVAHQQDIPYKVKYGCKICEKAKAYAGYFSKIFTPFPSF